MNIWVFTGNLGNDAEQRFLPNGDSLVSFSVGVKSGFGKNESTVWPKCTIFGDRGNSLLPYLKKGQQVAVSGETSLREWDDKEGNKRKSLEVRVNNVDLIGGKKDSESRGQKDRRNSDESDIPF